MEGKVSEGVERALWLLFTNHLERLILIGSKDSKLA